MQQCSYKVPVLFALAALGFGCLGYVLAVLSFRQDEWIEYHSGARKTTCRLYPFSVSSDGGYSAFQWTFKTHPDENAEWHLLESQYFIHPDTLLLREVTTTRAGNVMAGTHASLVRYALRRDLSMPERRALAEEFSRELRERGTLGAFEYAEELRSRELREALGDEAAFGAQDDETADPNRN